MGVWLIALPADIWNVSKTQLLTLKGGVYLAPLVKVSLNTLNSYVLEKSPSRHIFLHAAHTNIVEFIFTEITKIVVNCYPLCKVCELKKLHLYLVKGRNSEIGHF